MGVTYLPVIYHINWCTNVHVETTKHDINDTDNKQVYTAQVQVTIPTVPIYTAGVSREGAKYIIQAVNNVGNSTKNTQKGNPNPNSYVPP